MLLAHLSASLHHRHEQSYRLLEMRQKSNANNPQEATHTIKARRRNSASASLNSPINSPNALIDLNMQLLRARCHKLNQAATTLNHYPLAQLGTAPKELQKHYSQKLTQLDHLRDGLDCYVPLDGQTSEHSSVRFALLDKVFVFLDSPQKVLLLIGEAGLGKSTFNRYLSRLLSAECIKSDPTDTPITLFVPLDKYSINSEGVDWVENYLRQQQFSLATINALRTQQRFIFILEGADELPSTQYKEGLERILEGWQAKTIISARPEFTQKPCWLAFQTTAQARLCQTYWLAPFSEQAVQAYIQKYVEQVQPTGWSMSRYLKTLEDAPLLKAVVRRPSLLQMALEVLPLSAQKIPTSVAELCHAWLTQWWERSAQRMQGISFTPEEQAALKKVQPYLCAKGHHISQKMAISFTQARVTQETRANQRSLRNGAPEHSFQQRDVSPPSTLFSTTYKLYAENNTDQRLTFFNLPVCEERGNYRFIYPEVQTHLVAYTICGMFHRTVEVQPESVLNQFSLVHETSILDFLAEYAHQSAAFKTHLYDWIYQSKNNPLLSIGAANAITILVRMGEAFTQTDLRNICIAGADLRYGIFDHVDLRGADLRRGLLEGALLRHTRLENAQLHGAQFNALPYLPQPSQAKTCLYTPDGNHFAVGLAGDLKLKKGATIALYQTSTWKKIHTFTLQRYDIDTTQIAFSANSHYLAAVDAQGIVRRWDIPYGEELFSWYPNMGDQITHLTFSPSHPALLAVQIKSQAGWSIEFWQQHKRTSLYAEPMRYHSQFLCFSPNGAWLAIASAYKKQVQLWDIERQQVINTFSCAAPCHHLAFSPDSRLLALCEYGVQLSVWEIATQTCLWTTQDGVSSARAAFSPDGQFIAAYDLHHPLSQPNALFTIRLWHASSGELFHQQQGHTNELSTIAFSPDGTHYASSSVDKTVRLWKIPQRPPYVRNGHIKTIRGTTFSAAGSLLATCADDHTICLWKMPQGQLMQQVKRNSRYLGKAQALYFSTDGEWLFVQNTRKKIELYRVHNETELRTQPVSNNLRASNKDADTIDILLAPNGKKLIKQKIEFLEIWNRQTGKKEHSFYLPDLHHCLFSEDKQRLLAVCIHDTSISVRDVASQCLVHAIELAAHSSTLVDVIYSPRGEWFATTHTQHSVIIWHAHSGEQKYIFDSTTNAVQQIVFSPDDKWLAAISQNHTMHIWKVACGTCVAEIHLKDANIHSVAWHIDAEQSIYVVTGSDDAIVRLWQLQAHGSSASLVLWWASGQKQLMADATVLEGAQGLSLLDRTLLTQHGALSTTHTIAAVPKQRRPYKARTCQNFSLCAVM